MTVVQWARGANWRATLQHSCPHHALVWITRGQGIAVIEGVRRGVGVHNALAIPAGTMFSLDLGKSGFGLVCEVPSGGAVPMPDSPQHLRIRDVARQNELTSIFEAMQREQNSQRTFMDEALNAEANLVSVWLRRAMIDHPETERATAGERLVRAYAALIERDFQNGRSMAVYARALGVTPTHLTRVCKQVSGLTAADMLTERSLHAARALLEANELPVGQIAAYFSRFILHHTGQSPSALRSKPAARGPMARAV
jgi:AraC family transcriptional activator of pobA